METEGHFTTSLSDIFENLNIVLYTCCCFPCSIATNTATVTGDNCQLYHCCCFIHPYWIRQIIRTRIHARRNFTEDCVFFCCLPEIGTCLDAIEMKKRNLGASPYEYYFGENKQPNPNINTSTYSNQQKGEPVPIAIQQSPY